MWGVRSRPASTEQDADKRRALAGAPLWTIGAAVVLGLSARLCYLVIRYHAHDAGTKRPHIESAALLLAIFGLGFRFATDTLDRSDRVAPSRVSPAMWLVMVCGAMALYWPALFIGYLSDDFVLVQHAAAWHVGPVAAQLFRPVPLFMWSVLLNLGGGAGTLHTLNVLLHATNAFLTACVVDAWVRGRSWSLAAGFMVLVSPLAPEAVAWCAGVFDLSATALILAAVLTARCYTDHTTIATRILFVTMSLAALLSKETAVVGPVLVLIDSLALRRSLPRHLVADLLVVGGTVAVLAGMRLTSHPGLIAAPITRYRFQRVLFDSFGNLAAPWHADYLRTFPIARLLNGLSVICIVTGFFVTNGPRWRTITALAGALWVLVSVLPLLPMFYVSPQLEGARYLYLAAFGWAAILMTASADLGGRRLWAAVVVRSVVTLMIAIAVSGVRSHISPWVRAAAVRDTVVRAASVDSRLRACEVTYVRDLPQTVDGAYLFSNGAREALAGGGVNALTRDVSGPCSFRWDAMSSKFVPVSP
jgi:hypothetical protein